jgi:hypothetical protein
MSLSTQPKNPRAMRIFSGYNLIYYFVKFES